MQVKRKMSGGKSAHSFYSAPGIYHLRTKWLISVNVMFKRDVNGCQAFNSEYSRSGTEMADTRPMKIL